MEMVDMIKFALGRMLIHFQLFARGLLVMLSNEPELILAGEIKRLTAPVYGSSRIFPVVFLLSISACARPASESG